MTGTKLAVGPCACCYFTLHYDDVIMNSIASHITSLTTVYSNVHSGANQRKHQSSASLAFVWEIHRWPVNFPRKWPVRRKMFPFDDVIMGWSHDRCATDNSKETLLAFCGENLRTVGYPSQRVCNAESVSMSWRLLIRRGIIIGKPGSPERLRHRV